MAFLANLRSTIAYQPSGATVSTGAIYTAASSGAAWSNALVSSMVSIGTSTNQTYTTLSQGNFTSTSNWVTSLTGRTSTIGVSMSANAQTQLVVSQVSTVSSIQFTSTLGQTWSTLSNVTGLPSSLTTSYSAGAISGNGQYGLLAASGGYLYTTANSGASWTNTNPNTPVIYLPFETAPVNGATIGGTTLTVSPSVPALVPGIVGKTAVNLVNTPAGTATQYIRGSWINAGLTSFTVSLWFNMQSTTTDYSYIFSAFNSTLAIIISTNTLIANIPMAASPYYMGITIPAYQIIALNTWYNVTLIWQAAGSCYMYLNNVLYGSATGAGIFGGTTSNLFALSGFDNGPVNAFNGYVDDLKIYNSAISTTPFSPMVPQNWSNIALSNSGQYMLATATGSGLFLSLNFGSTWTQVTSAMLYAAWTAAQVSATGQYLVANSPVVNVQPQLTGFTSSTAAQSSSSSTSSWQTGGVTWIASASSVLGSNPISSLFDNIATVSWAGNSALYNSSGNTVAASTTIIGITQSPSTTGDWIQLQSSIPLVMYSYQFANGAAIYQTPKIFYIAGSTDAVNWYPIQSASITSTTGTGSIRTLVPGMILVNSSGSQSFGSLSLTGTTYATTTNAYTYFRFIFTAIFSTSNDYLALSELVVNFQAGGQTYSTNYGLTWNNGYSIPSNVLALSPSGQTALSAPLITPQQTGLRGDSTSATVIPTTWQQNGITWTSLASSVFGSAWQPWIAFNNVVPLTTAGGLYSWASSANYNAGTGTFNFPTVTTNTVIQSPAAQTYYGDWLQMYSNVPLVLYSYNLGANNGAPTNIPKTYFIVGSTDNSNWYPIQRVSIDTNPFAIASTGIPTSPPIIVNQSGSQTMTSSGGSSGILTCTTYTTTTNAYNYFRIIANTLFGGTSFELEEWFVNFQNANGGTTYNVVPSLQAFSTGTSTSGSIPGVITGSAVSNTGQYIVVITNATTGNNVYYSTNTGATFTGLQLGSLVMTSCAISYDGSYITVSNATTVYQLNNNSTGYTVAVGNQAGLQNQAVNAIAIGNYAGTINQTANSIILNASGQSLNSVAQGFYVAPIASYTASSSPYFSIMGYGLDNQVTHSNGAISMLSNGNIGIGVTTPSAALHARSSFLVDDVMIQFPPSAITNASNTLTGQYPGQYIVTSSSNRNGTGEQYHVFDYNPTTFWQVTFPPTATTTASGSIYTGEWVQLQSPYLFTLTSYAVYSQSSAPTQWVIVGSTNGTTWTLLDSQVSQNILTLSTYTVQSSAYSYYRYIMMASGSITPALFTWNLYGNPQLIKSIGGATTIGGPLTALGGTTTIGGPLTALGGITNMGWTQVNYFGSNGYLSLPGPGGSVYYILSGTVRSSDTSYFYVYPPVPCYLTGYVVYGINTPSQPQAEAPLAAGYPTSTKIGAVSFNLGGAPVGNSTTIIHYTVYCRT